MQRMTSASERIAHCLGVLSFTSRTELTHVTMQGGHSSAHDRKHEPGVSLCIAGARLQSLVFKKYVLGLGWRIAMKPDGSVKVQSGDAILPAAQACCEAVLCQLDSLADCLEVNTFTDLPRLWSCHLRRM